MISELLGSVKYPLKFRGYRPQPVTPASFWRWIWQFDSDLRGPIMSLLDHVIYLDERQTLRNLVNQNARLLQRLADAGIKEKNVIYVQIHDAGSSSPVMLNILRDAASLERRGCRFIDSNNVIGLSDLTNELGEGAIVYVDDFSGTGNQFTKVRDFVKQFIIGTFPEFFLLPAICEEAVLKLGREELSRSPK